MPPKTGRSDPRRTKADQQGAKGRLTSDPSQSPVLVPRTSKVPAQDSDFLTTSQGTRLAHTDDSLKAGARGPTLMEDFHLREKITHFDHERIPERVVHARGAGAHGVFESYGTAAGITSAEFLQPGRSTPVFTRFSTVVGSRGSADTVRDVRGFAVKFYTDAGVFDLVGNNIPVFFIRDGIKFPDLIHAAKPEPDREIPQAQTAHTTFWDFVSSIPESPHMLMWAMSDRAIPRSYRMMEGFGVHTFRLVNAEGDFEPRQVPLEAGARRARTAVGGGADAERRRPRLPPPGPLQRDRRRGVPRMGAGRAGDARQRRPVLQRDRPARRDQAGSRGARTGAARGPHDAQPLPGQLLRRGRTGRLSRRSPRARHRGRRRPAHAGPPVQLSRHATHAARRTELLADPDQPASLTCQRQLP